MFLLILSVPLCANDAKELYKLREKVFTLTQQNNQLLQNNELLSNNRLAKYESRLLIKTLSYEIHLYLKKQGVKRSVAKIESIVEACYVSSWIFTDLGKDHIDRMALMLQWAREESSFNPSLITHWKAGTYLESIKRTVTKDTVDYGAFQINEMHSRNLKTINFLYDSSVINFKVKRVRGLKDIMDVRTNCVARCIIETDRKSRGWEWHHTRDKKFRQFIATQIESLERQHLYSRRFVEKYYFTTPIRHYSSREFSY